MIAYLLTASSPLYPFSRPASSFVFRGGTLRQRLTEQLQKAGYTVKEVDSLDAVSIETNSLVLSDDVIISDSLIKTFLKAIPSKKKNYQLEIDVSRYPMMTPKEHESQYRTMPIYYIGKAGQFSDLRTEIVSLTPKATLIVEDGLPERMHELKNLQAHFLELFALQIRYWFDLQVATTCYCGEFVAKLAAPAGMLPEMVSNKIFSWTWLMEKANVVGKNTRIHPTAVLEGCVIGDNVEIGPYAYLRSAVVDDGAVLRERSTVKLSYIGKHAYIVGSDVLNCYIGHESSVITPLLYHMVFGEYSFISGGSGFADFNAGSTTVTAVVGDEEMNTNLYYLGSCVADHCFIGANMIFAPGRAIPDGTRFLDQGLLKNLPKEGNNTYVLSGNQFIQIPQSFFGASES